MKYTYLTTAELSERIMYEPRTIRTQLLIAFFVEGVHYIRPFGGRKILFIGEHIEELILQGMGDIIPLVNGGFAWQE